MLIGRAYGRYFTRSKQHICYSFYYNLETLDQYLIVLNKFDHSI